MATNTAPIFIGSPDTGSVRLTNQVLARDGVTGSALTLVTAGASGAFIESITCFPEGDFAANVLRLFFLEAGGSTRLLRRELGLTAATSTNATSAISGYPLTLSMPPIAFGMYSGATGFRLGAGDSLLVALGTASGVGLVVSWQGGQYAAS